MTEFTKGPWAAEPSTPHDGFEYFKVRGGTKHVADVPGPQSGESMANAQLIAAAPDLYEALDRFVGWMDEEEGAHALCDSARLVLAKAKGAL